MKIKLSELRKIVRSILVEDFGGIAGPTVSAAATPGKEEKQQTGDETEDGTETPEQKSEPESGNEPGEKPENFEQSAEKLHVGFYPYEIERGVPAPPPIISSNKLGP